MQIVALAVIVLAVAAATFFGFQAERSGSPAFWGLVGGPTVVLAAIGAVRAQREGVLGEWLRPRWGDFSRAFVSAAAMFAGAYVFTKTFAPPGSPREIWLVALYTQIGDPRALQAHALVVGLVIFVTAAAEEILWRGLVTSLWAERFGSRFAWVGAAFLYALAHVPTMWSLRIGNGPLNPLVPLAALGAGLVWGWMARRFDRLWPSVVSHALFDWVVVMMFPLWGLPRIA